MRKVLWLCFAVVVSPGPHCEISPAVMIDCIAPELPSLHREQFWVGNPDLNREWNLQAAHTGILTVLSRYPRWYAVSSGLVEMGWESIYLVWAFENGPGRAQKCVVAEITWNSGAGFWLLWLAKGDVARVSGIELDRGGCGARVQA